MQRLFSASGAISESKARNDWRSLSGREFYDGDLEFEGEGDDSVFTFDKGLCYPVSFTHLTASCGLSYRRTWKHIRTNKVGFRVIWFVVRGALRISRSEGTFEIREGEAGILDADAPFHCKVRQDENGCFGSYQLIIPGYLFLAHLQGADHISKAFDLKTPDGQVVQRMLQLLVSEGENLSRMVAKPLVDSLLEAVANCISKGQIDLSKRQTLVDRRLSDIENYIMMNLTDPDLCYGRVAASCSISPRYLCYVLKANNTSFSELLWKNRLAKAKGLLLTLAMQDFPIQEVAFMSGFKSAAHFSRMFKAAYGCPPKEFRNANSARAPEALEPPVGKMLNGRNGLNGLEKRFGSPTQIPGGREAAS